MSLTPAKRTLTDTFSFGPQSLVNSSINHGAANRSDRLDPNASMLHASPRLSRMHNARQQAKGKGKLREQSFAMDFGDLPVGDDEDWTTIDRMRLWRHDAMLQHLHSTAVFWADKILSWTNDPNDAFWLAQIYYNAHQYSRAEYLLTKSFRFTVAPPNEQEKSFLGPDGSDDDIPDRLVDISVQCRYLCAQCQIAQAKWSEALETLGDSNPFHGTSRSGPGCPNSDGGLKIESSMCYLRGLLMLKLNRTQRAKECFMEALALDVKNFEAFETLVGGEMMTGEEEWEFVQSLEYDKHAPHEAEFVRLMYTSRLKKYKHVEEQKEALTTLSTTYNLRNNPDVLYGFASMLETHSRYKECFLVTSKILSLSSPPVSFTLVDVSSEHPFSQLSQSSTSTALEGHPTYSYSQQALALHIGCMYHLPQMHSKLFLLAHELVDKEPESAVSWYAVGMWYFIKERWSDARKYFSKTSLMDPRFSPAWIAFGHTFAQEREHDHAITAYSTAARLFQGSHLPLLFLGMEHLKLGNLSLADDALSASAEMCQDDPLVWNERGVFEGARENPNWEKAIEYFERALSLARVETGSQQIWIATYLNLGTAYRKIRRLDQALENYKRVLAVEPRHAAALCYIGMVYQYMDLTDLAVNAYHESLAIDQQSSLTLDLLNLTLEAASDSLPTIPALVGEADHKKWRSRVKEIRAGEAKLGIRNATDGNLGALGEEMSVDMSL